jgi:hypothetical protein
LPRHRRLQTADLSLLHRRLLALHLSLLPTDPSRATEQTLKSLASPPLWTLGVGMISYIRSGPTSHFHTNSESTCSELYASTGLDMKNLPTSLQEVLLKTGCLSCWCLRLFMHMCPCFCAESIPACVILKKRENNFKGTVFENHITHTHNIYCVC